MERRSPGRSADRLFLAGIVVASAAPYVGRLRFYSDDWSFLSLLHLADDRSLVGLIREQLTGSVNLQVRPTQAAYQAVLYRLFGLDPLGYHLMNLAVLVVLVLLLHAVLRRLGLPRWIAVAVPAVYGLASNYATDRFWFAAFGYLLGVALWLGALYADLRAVEGSSSPAVWGWKVLALVALTIALLGQEVVLPLFLLNIVVPEVHARRRLRRGAPVRIGGRLAFHGAVLAVVSAVIVYKVVVYAIAPIPAVVGFEESLPLYAARLVSGAVLTDFGTHGIGLPYTAWWSAPAAGVAGVLVALAVGVAVYLYLGSVAREDAVPWTSKAWARMGTACLAVYVLGYAIFTMARRIQFSGTGMANRVAAAATLGVALILVGVAGWASTRLRWPRVRGPAVRACVAGLCLAGVVVCNGLGSYWARSAHSQLRIMTEVRGSLPEIPPESAVLLGGVCPYEGPAPVFESPFDFAGALRILHRDRSIRADVVTERLAVEPQAVTTTIYGVEFRYPFGRDLLLHDASRRRTVALADDITARRELEALEDLACAEGQPGKGSVLLPFDRVLIVLVDTRFQPWQRL